MSETELSRSIRRALTQLGVWCIRVQAGVLPLSIGGAARYIHGAEPGTPDLCLPAIGWLEVKTAKGKLVPSQVVWHARAKREGVRVAVVRSVGEAVTTVRGWMGAAA